MKRLPLKGPLLLSLVLHLILLFAVGLMAGRRTIQKPRLLIGVKLMEPGRGTEGHDSSAGGSKEALEHSLSSLTASMLEAAVVKVRNLELSPEHFVPKEQVNALLEQKALTEQTATECGNDAVDGKDQCVQQEGEVHGG